MNVVAPITVAWQGVVDSVTGGAKEFETFNDLSEAIIRAREVNDASESLQNSQYAGSDPKAHITIHPGAYEYGTSVDESLDDIFITILPGARITDSSTNLPSDTTKKVADLNSFAETAFFSEEDDTFIFEGPVEFRDRVVFEENTFPVKSVEGGPGLGVTSTFGDVTVFHEETGGASSDTNENTFLNQIQTDQFGHLEDFQFTTVTTGVSIEEDDSLVLGLAESLNFASNLSVVESQDQSATITIPGTEDFQISELQKLFPFGEPLSETSGTSGVEAKLAVSTGKYSKNDLLQNDTETQKGVIDETYTVEGELNPQVKNTDLHDANIFTKASTGNLKLVLNGSNLVTMDLSSMETSIVETSNSGNSTLSVSSASPLLYPNREVFEKTSQRTGNWEVGTGDLNTGLNTIKIVHEISGEVFGETQELHYFLENTSFAVSIANASFDVSSTSPTFKQLSGVNYHTDVTVDFSVDIDNAYRNSYSAGKAIDFPVSRNVDLLPQQVPELEENETEDAQINLSEQRDVLASRLVLRSPRAQLQIEDPIEGKKTSSKASNLELMLDGAEDLSTETTHVFETEDYRIDPEEDFDSIISIGDYDSSNSIRDDGEYSNQLQVTDGKVVYPSVDYSQLQNGPSGNPDYSQNVTGQRQYYGFFKNERSVSNFVLEVNGIGEIVSPGSLSPGTQVASVEIKAPTQTGWLDVNNFFIAGKLQDGNGAYQATNAENPKNTIGPDSEIGLTIGEKDTIDSYNRLYYRITAPENWTGEITKMDISWGVS